jgi:hypothetical protein
MDHEDEKKRQTYQICLLGFALLSGALALASGVSILGMYQLGCLFGLPGPARLDMPWMRWLEIPIVWVSLAGSYMLCGRWSGTGWSRRAALLAAMCAVDAVMWLLHQGFELGYGLGGLDDHRWLCDAIGIGLGWCEFALLASLAADFLTHLGVETAENASRATRSLAATGAAVWLLEFWLRTDWHQWPLHVVRWQPQTLLLFLGRNIIWMITLLQVTALVMAAAGQALTVVKELNAEERADDLFASPSDSSDALLKTRETDPFA